MKTRSKEVTLEKLTSWRASANTLSKEVDILVHEHESTIEKKLTSPSVLEKLRS
jgi:hypothetical protein